jgi:hypothetical protein
MKNDKELEKNEKTRKPYRKPQLGSLGDLRSLTLGGSPGTGESGGFTYKVHILGPVPPPPTP